MAAPSRASAKLCGDDVDGQRIACDCADIVVSDTTLRAIDPVTGRRCPGSGLFLRAPAGAASIRLDLGGLSLVGSGIGTGIRVLDGGYRGAVLVGDGAGGSGEVVGFDTGIHAYGTRAVLELSGLTVKGNRRDGLSLRSSGASLSDVRAEKNGGDGFRLDGHACSYSGLVARENRGAGIRLSGSAALIQAESSGNGAEGARVAGRGHDLSAVEASGNGGAGLLLTGGGHRTVGARSHDNAGGQIVDRTQDGGSSR